MENYRNYGGNSNVESFGIGPDYIDIRFNGTAKLYRYSYPVAGKNHVENMKELALAGSGLNGYINSNVKFKYDK